MTEASTYSDDDADALERYLDSSDDEAPVPEPQPEKPKRVYKRKPVEEDKRRKGNHARTPAQVAAFERMLEVRRQMNDDRKVAKTTKMMKRTKAIEEKVSKRRTKEDAEDELVAERLARKPARKQPAARHPGRRSPHHQKAKATRSPATTTNHRHRQRPESELFESSHSPQPPQQCSSGLYERLRGLSCPARSRVMVWVAAPATAASASATA